MSETQTNATNKVGVARVLYTILYLIIARFISMILFIIAVMQFIYSWFSDGPNENISIFSKHLSEYTKQIVLYTGLNSDEKPWPVGKWPSDTV